MNSRYIPAVPFIPIVFGSVKELRESLFVSVCLWGTKCSKALNLHLSLIGLSQVSLGSVSGQSQVSLCLLRQTDGA